MLETTKVEVLKLAVTLNLGSGGDISKIKNTYNELMTIIYG